MTDEPSSRQGVAVFPPSPQSRRALGLEAHETRMAARRQAFRDLYDFHRGRGLEIGPLDAAIATRDVADVSYVDVRDAAGTREYYANDDNVMVELIPDIDFTLDDGERIRTVGEAVSSGAPYDWVIASHVIEHVPDLIGWLAELADVVADGGALVLAVPHRSYCFDVHRAPTTVGQVLEAHDLGATRPSVRAVYDYVRSKVEVEPGPLWRGERPPGLGPVSERRASLDAALARVRAGEYVDAHVWTFTPESFASQVAELRGLDLTPWYVEEIRPLRGNIEFHAVLRRLPRGQGPSQAVVEEPPAEADMPEWVFSLWQARDQARQLEEQVDRLRRRVRRQRRRIRALEERVAALRGSVRMRVGSAIVAPADRARRLLRRG